MNYNSYESLQGKTLEYGDDVTFKVDDSRSLRYNVREDHLNHKDGTNSALFDHYEMTERDKYKFASEYYGYQVEGGGWPTTEHRDYPALTRLALAIFAGIEGVEADLSYEAERKEVIIHKEQKVVKTPAKFKKVMEIMTLNGDYKAEIRADQVQVGCQKVKKEAAMELIIKTAKAWGLKPEDLFVD